MTEEEILDDVFDMKWTSSSGNKYVITYCDMCDVWIIGCHDKNCSATTCNAAGCDKCSKDFDEFNLYKSWVGFYLSEEELRVYEKCKELKKFIKESILMGDVKINFKKLKEQGKLSERHEEMFKKELE